ncbi:HAD family hydrolase [Virgibacillus sp. DJP39]|uniref:HAD family hydrolase n=1 Tax=Virgibacillus sp. DJP39 TaxID=3409790 RepID=UPI003BB4DA64
MIRAVLFDLDGTLLDRDQSVRNFIDGQYERMINLLGHIPKQVYTTRFLQLDSHGYVWKDKVYQQMVEEFSIELPWGKLLEDYIYEFKHSCIAFPNLIQMLEELKDKSIRMGIITNGKGQFQLDNIRALGIENYFNPILISEWEKLKKPDPLIFHKALNQLGAKPDETIFVGDHPENDIRAAANVGMKTIWKKNDLREDVQAIHTINDLMEITKAVEIENHEKGANL